MLELVSNKFDENQYENIGILLHVVGILLCLSKFGIYKVSKHRIVKKAKRNINLLTKTRRLNIENDSPDHLSFNEYYGHGFIFSDTSEFVEVKDHLKLCIKKAVTAQLPERAIEFLEALKNDTQKFVKDLTSFSEEKRYYDKPILAYINPQCFVDAVINKLPDLFRSLPEALKERYRHSLYFKDLQLELAWLRRVKTLVTKEIKNRAGKISAVQLEHLNKALSECIKTLELSIEPASEEQKAVN